MQNSRNCFCLNLIIFINRICSGGSSALRLREMGRSGCMSTNVADVLTTEARLYRRLRHRTAEAQHRRLSSRIDSSHKRPLDWNWPIELDVDRNLSSIQPSPTSPRFVSIPPVLRL